MDRVKVDASMDGLPMSTKLDPRPTERPLHDKAVNDGPTTANGPLSTKPETLQDRQIVAHYATPAAADAARITLLEAGIPASAMTIIQHAAQSEQVKAETRPADDTLIGRIREAILPDEASAAARDAISHDDAILEVTPARNQVETIIRLIEASNPTRFDADLQRWRNKG